MNQLKQMKMVGNKFNTEFAIHKPKFYKLQFEDQNGIVQSMQGTTKQVLNYILNQQL
jgi:hypothetical protein